MIKLKETYKKATLSHVKFITGVISVYLCGPGNKKIFSQFKRFDFNSENVVSNKKHREARKLNKDPLVNISHQCEHFENYQK